MKYNQIYEGIHILYHKQVIESFFMYYFKFKIINKIFIRSQNNIVLSNEFRIQVPKYVLSYFYKGKNIIAAIRKHHNWYLLIINLPTNLP